jgi:hypothetical protein
MCRNHEDLLEMAVIESLPLRQIFYAFISNHLQRNSELKGSAYGFQGISSDSIGGNMALSVKLYRVVGKGKDRRYVAIDLERRGRRSKEDVTGPFYLRYGLKYESVGMDFKAAVEAMQRRQATLDAVGSGVAVKADGDPNRRRVVDEVKKFLAKKSLLKDLKTVKTYTERLGYFLDWCERSGIKHLDQLTVGDDLLPYVSSFGNARPPGTLCLNPVTFTTFSKRATPSCVQAPVDPGSSRQNAADASALALLPAAKCKQKSSSYVHPNRNISNATHP